MINDYSVIYDLPGAWWDMTVDAFENKKFDREAFLNVFRKSFEILRKYSCTKNVDRDVMELVIKMSGFISTKFHEVNYEHIAACELTDALLYNCFYLESFSEHEIPKTEITKGEWCLLPGGGMEVDFTDPENVLFNFAWDLEKWDSMPVRPSKSDE